MKRKTTDSRGAPLEAGASSVVAALLRHCCAWRDACGRAFRVERKIERRADRIVVRVARFDRLKCTHLLATIGAVPATDHAVDGFEAALESGEVHITIKRIPSAPRPAPEAPPPAPPYKGNLADVQACDTAACAAAAGALLAAHGVDALGGIVVRRRAAWYEVAACGLAHVSDAACHAVGTWPAAYVDFDNREHVCIVDRSRPGL